MGIWKLLLIKFMSLIKSVLQEIFYTISFNAVYPLQMLLVIEQLTKNDLIIVS